MQVMCDRLSIAGENYKRHLQQIISYYVARCRVDAEEQQFMFPTFDFMPQCFPLPSPSSHSIDRLKPVEAFFCNI